MKLALRLATWFVVLWWLWMLLVGEWNHVEWIAAALAAGVGAALWELLRARTNTTARVPGTWIGRARSVPHQIVVDFGIVTWALLRSVATRKVARGAFRAHEFPATSGSRTDVGIRAWTDLVANYSPNALTVDIDREHGLSLVHDLVPNRASEKPA